MALTSFAILGVIIYSNNEFKKDSKAVQRAIFLTDHLANIRLVFRSLMLNTEAEEHGKEDIYEMLIGELEHYYDLLREDQNKL